ncbi:uncharacterized protein ACWYII_024383 [Salvelinus alpinus]
MAGESNSLPQPNGEALEAASRCSEVIKIHYPVSVKNDKARKDHKMKLLMENQETLFADYYKNGNISNLIFHTNHPLAWHSAILAHYPSVKRGGVNEGWKLRILDNEDEESANINLYKSGTVMVQGNHKQFQLDFHLIKELAQQEKLSLDKDTPTPSGSDQTSSPYNPTDEQPSANSQPPSTEHSSLIEMKDKFTQLEVRQVELEQQVITLQSAQTQTTVQHNNTPLTRPGELEVEKDISALWTVVRQHQQEKEQKQEQNKALEERIRLLEERERGMEERIRLLEERLRGMACDREQPTREVAIPTETPAEQPTSAPDKSLDTTAEQSTPDPDHRVDITAEQTKEKPQAQQLSPPLSTPPVSHPDSPPDNPPTPTEDKHKTQIFLLMDSNGKYIEEKKLFPKHSVSKLWCPNTQRALDLLSEDKLGSPSHIIIHTGTNDLRAQQERVATALKGVIEKASSTFPNAQVVISTLLPRKDFHPATIQRVNASISRDCASKPNVFLAHHSTLDLNSLYDQVHLYKAAVPTFARTLKDIALKRSPNTSHRSNRSIDTPPRPARHPPRPPGPPPGPTHPPHINHAHTQFRPPQIRPMPLLPTPCTPPPQRGHQHGSHTYAQVVSGQTGPTPTLTLAQANGMYQMLSRLCSHLLA